VGTSTIELPKQEAANVSEREYGILCEVPEHGFGIDETADYLGIECERLRQAVQQQRISGLPKISDMHAVRFSQKQIDRIADFFNDEVSDGLGKWARMALSEEERRRFMESALNSRD
jgi:hypothetical protein